ncbi:hypothetical protein EON65_33570 [archaeon]|nr:MAG: hypothetical protein EON65_33570 [archaeon]
MNSEKAEAKQGEGELVVTTVESDENESEDRPHKKARISTDGAAPQHTPPAKPDEPHCLVCMETASEDTTLLKHQCSQCSPDAWQVCESCNSALLSRTCPVCRGEYAPIVMYAMPGKCLLFCIFTVKYMKVKYISSSSSYISYIPLPQTPS